MKSKRVRYIRDKTAVVLHCYDPLKLVKLYMSGGAAHSHTSGIQAVWCVAQADFDRDHGS